MTVRYLLTAEDGLRFCEYHVTHSPIVGRQIARERYLYPLAGIVIGLTYWWATGRMEVLVAAAVLGAGWTLWWPVRWRRGYVQGARKTYAEPENQSLFGEHTLALDGEGLVVRTAAGVQTTYPWAAIGPIVEEPGFLYLYVNGLSAITIPERGIVEGDFDALREALVSRFDEPEG